MMEAREQFDCFLEKPRKTYITIWVEDDSLHTRSDDGVDGRIKLANIQNFKVKGSKLVLKTTVRKYVFSQIDNPDRLQYVLQKAILGAAPSERVTKAPLVLGEKERKREEKAKKKEEERIEKEKRKEEKARETEGKKGGKRSWLDEALGMLQNIEIDRRLERGEKVCSDCGTKMLTTYKFCPECGSKMPVPLPTVS